MVGDEFRSNARTASYKDLSASVKRVGAIGAAKFKFKKSFQGSCCRYWGKKYGFQMNSSWLNSETYLEYIMKLELMGVRKRGESKKATSFLTCASRGGNCAMRWTKKAGGRGSFKATSQEVCFGRVKLEMLINSQVKIQRRQMDILNIFNWASTCFKNIFYIFHMANLVHGAYTQSCWSELWL